MTGGVMSRLHAAAAAVLAAAVLVPATAQARVLHVHPGQSIQAAVRRAHAGDTIVVAAGRYHQNVAIHKSHLTLRGAGAGPRGTVLLEPRRPTTTLCEDPESHTAP